MGLKYDKLPPWNYPPFDARWFDKIASTTIGTSVTITLISFIVPSTSPGIIKWFGQGVDPNADEGFANLTWQIKVNRGPDLIYGSITQEISTFLEPTEVFVQIPINSLVELVVTNNSTTTTFAISGRLKGWYWFDIQENIR